ncbi:hypothetical protein BT63DRAFT_419330 [Microthyrium microscopicum]|uniref:EF-hand domain-containing protein n=1 Tax=Microthyrium microscopicum TaxID=703497 RepID=A0A6A6UNZ1_9PEZI|nr:hypothetical protein BT63DRAFT_419330 [Microthyrium microscopicum]
MDSEPPAYHDLTTNIQHDDHDEVLPDYEPPSCPTYTSTTPLINYTIYNTRSRLRTLIPSTESSAIVPSYIITSPPRFSSSSHHTLARIATSPSSSRRSSTANMFDPPSDAGSCTAVVAELRAVRHSTIPWCPKVSVTVKNPLEERVFVLNAKDFSAFELEVGPRRCKWCVTGDPKRALELVDTQQGGRVVVARMTYSAMGTDAVRGQPVGTLDVFDLDTGGEVSEDEVLEIIIGSCEMVIRHWKDMGRHFKNVTTRVTGMLPGAGHVTGSGGYSFGHGAIGFVPSMRY